MKEEDFVRACGDRNTSIEFLSECLDQNPSLANASALLQAESFGFGRRSTPRKWTALERAALYRKDAERVRLLLIHGADAEAKLEEYGGKNTENTILILASRGHGCSVEVVSALLEHGANPNAVGDGGTTAMMGACCNGGKEAIVRLLISKGADVHAKSCYQRTPLNLHCKSYDISPAIVQLLIDKGADVNTADENGFTPLMGACCNGHLEVARLLIDSGANVDACDYDNCTPLLGVCQDPSMETSTGFMRLLLEKGASPNIERGCGCTAFSATVGMASIEQIKLLLDYGADVNSGCHCDGKPLQNAIKSSSWELANLFLERGANVSDRCLLLAVQYGADIEFLTTLLDRGAPIDQVDPIRSDSALSMAAVKRKDVGIVQFLLEKGAGINARGDANGARPEYSSTPWLKLVSDVNPDMEIVNLFIRKGALVNDCNPKGNTPLMLARTVPMVQTLLAQESINVNATNAEGDTALISHVRTVKTFGNSYPSTEIIQTLLNKSTINKNAKNETTGETALMVAVVERRADVVRMLLDSGGVDTNQTDKSGKTALHKAAIGSNCLMPVPPPQFLNGSMSILIGRSPQLTIEGKWGIDESSSRDQKGKLDFWFRRDLEDRDPVQLNQLEQLSGIFQSGYRMRFQRGGSRQSSDGDVELSFSRVIGTPENGDVGPVSYNVKGEGSNQWFGIVNVEGNVSLKPSNEDDAISSAEVRLTKRYKPGTGTDRNALLAFNGDILKTMEGSNADGGSDYERPTLKMAVQKDYLAIVDTLLQNGADVNMPDASQDGNTPLMITCLEHNDALDMVQLLVSKGASVDAQNNSGKTALMLANEQNFLSTVYFLLRSDSATLLKGPSETGS